MQGLGFFWNTVYVNIYVTGKKAHTTLEMGDNVIYLNFEYVNLVSSSVTNLVNQGEKSRLYSIESADSTSTTDDRLNRPIRLSPTLSTQLDSNVKRSTRSIDSIDFGV